MPKLLRSNPSQGGLNKKKIVDLGTRVLSNELKIFIHALFG